MWVSQSQSICISNYSVGSTFDWLKQLSEMHPQTIGGKFYSGNELLIEFGLKIGRQMQSTVKPPLRTFCCSVVSPLNTEMLNY